MSASRIPWKSISAEFQLWHGSTMIASWSDTATTKQTILETYGVPHGENYTLVTGTIKGVPFSGQVSENCP